MKNNYKGFTLIETLLALFTIAVLCVMVIPSFFNSFEEKLIITKLQKIHTNLEEAYKKAILIHGAPQYWNNMYVDGLVPFNFLLENTEILLNCGNKENCPSNASYYSLDGTVIGKVFSSNDNNGCTALMDGSLICISSLKNECKGNLAGTMEICGSIYVDLNGKKGPNKFGVDSFVFYYTKSNIVPAGIANVDINILCNKNYKYRFNGQACTAWVLTNNNMDYLKKKIH